MEQTTAVDLEKLYRVQKEWNDAKSQNGNGNTKNCLLRAFISSKIVAESIDMIHKCLVNICIINIIVKENIYTLRGLYMTKKIMTIAVLISFLMTLIPAGGLTVYADVPPYFSGSGTQLNPYVISTPEGMKYLADTVNAGTTFSGVYFSMANDIDLGAYEWVPIGINDNTFKGNFDGNGHVIKNMKIGSANSPANYTYTGLFGSAAEGKIHNLGIDASCIIYAAEYAGGIAGRSSAIIENCFNSSVISSSGNYSYVGGIAGVSTTIKNCYNTGAISTSGQQSIVGGIAGNSSSLILNSYNSCSVIGTGSLAGGIAGKASIIANCYNTGNVLGRNSAGGIFGSDAYYVVNCYNSGNITASNWASGGIGAYADINIYIYNSYNVGAIIGQKAGGIIGRCTGNNQLKIEGYYSSLSAEKGVGEGTNWGIKMNADDMKSDAFIGILNEYASSFSAFNYFTLSKWSKLEGKNNGFPVLCGVGDGSQIASYNIVAASGSNGTIAPSGTITVYENSTQTFVMRPAFGFKVSDVLVDSESVGAVNLYSFSAIHESHTISVTYTKYLAGAGTLNDPFLIETAENLKYVADNVNIGNISGSKYFRMTKDIDLVDYSWVPIGNESNKFDGYFDGNGFIIKNLKIGTLDTPANFKYCGLFGYLKSGSDIMNVGLDQSCRIYNVGASTGGIAGHLDSSTLIVNCFNKADIYSSGECVGGIAGTSYKIANCFNIGLVNCTNSNGIVGGIVGYYYSAPKNCYNTGAIINSGLLTGGIAGRGYNNSENLENCVYKENGTFAGIGTGANTAIKMTDNIMKSNSLADLLNSYLINTPSVYNIPFAKWARVDNINNGYPVLCGIGDGNQFSAYLITASAGTNGKITPSGTVKAYEHSLQMYIITPDEGFRVKDVLIDGVSVGSVYSYAFSEITGNHTIDVTFEKYLTGLGTLQSPYNINTAEDLKFLSDTVNSGVNYSTRYFSLNDDIDLSAYDWMPIGTNINPFKGVFDGNDHTISNLKIGTKEEHASFLYCGLFGYVSYGEIKNIVLNLNTEIYNCNDNSFTGGIVGYLYYSKAINCVVDGNVSGTGKAVGGFAGGGERSILNRCINQSCVFGDAESAGGLVGYNNDSSIVNSCNVGNIKVLAKEVGGISGTVQRGCNIANCFNKGIVESTYDNCYAGGIIGRMVTNSSPNGGLQNCYNIGKLNSNSEHTAGIIGSRQGLTIFNCAYLDSAASKGDATDSIEDITDKLSESELKATDFLIELNQYIEKNPVLNVFSEIINTPITFAKWSKFADRNNGYPIIVGIGEGKTVPSYTITTIAAANGAISPAGSITVFQNSTQTFKMLPVEGYIAQNILIDGISMGAADSYVFIDIIGNHTISCEFEKVFTTSGTEADPYIIDAATDLKYLSDSVNRGITYEGKYIKVVKNIDLSGYQWIPIGLDDYWVRNNFRGTFDGNGYKIINMDADTGLFGFVKNAIIKNVIVEDSYSGSVEDYPTGGIIGYAENSTIQNCSFSGKVEAIDYEDDTCGGVVGRAKESTIDGCANFADINGLSCAGGIVGETEGNTIIKNCYNSGNIDGYLAGGIGGKVKPNISGKVFNCSNYGSIGLMEKTATAGGIIGYLDNCKNLSYCRNFGVLVVEGSFSRCGGIAGYALGSTISQCKNNGNVYDFDTAESLRCYDGGIIGECNSTKIVSCSNSGMINNMGIGYQNNSGGIAGETDYNSLIFNCYNEGNVINDSYRYYSNIGGIVARNHGNVFNCYNIGNITGSEYYERQCIGGIIGEMQSGEVNNCYNTGNVSGAQYCGAIFGDNSLAYRTFSNLFYRTSSAAVGSGGSGNNNRYTTQYSDAQLKASSFSNTLNSYWNTAALPAGFTKEQLQIWGQNAAKNGGYPYFVNSTQQVVTVSEQDGMLIAENVNSSAFLVTTQNMLEDENITVKWYSDAACTVAAAAPIGVAYNAVMVLPDTLALFMTTDATSVKGTYYFRVTADGVDSPPNRLVIEPNYVLGDASGNRSVELIDAVTILRHIAGLQTLAGSNFAAADTNKDGTITIIDAVQILRFIAGLSSNLVK